MRLVASALLMFAGLILWMLAEVNHNHNPWFIVSSMVCGIGSIANSIVILSTYKGAKRQ